MFDIRCARLDDLDEVLSLWARAAGPTRRAGQLRDAEVLLGHDANALLRARTDGQLIGTLIVGVDAMVDRDNVTGIAFWEREGFEFDTADGRWSLLLGHSPAE